MPKAKKIPKPRGKLTYALPPDLRDAFILKCNEMGKTHSEVLRDWTEGFVAGRNKIVRPPEVDQAIKEAYE